MGKAAGEQANRRVLHKFGRRPLGLARPSTGRAGDYPRGTLCRIATSATCAHW